MVVSRIHVRRSAQLTLEMNVYLNRWALSQSLTAHREISRVSVDSKSVGCPDLTGLMLAKA